MAPLPPSATTGVSAGPDDRLDSWKEIATYLKRGVRTVQRWEHSAGLPVHRLNPDRPGSVFAYKSELDAWWSKRRQSDPGPEQAESAQPRPKIGWLAAGAFA